MPLARLIHLGMGNRFRELPQYFSLIRGHGVVAAITFLLIVPSAILILRFHDRNPRLALRVHIWLQILTVLLTTVVFVLGWFAVGPKRSLTNPHHGIGLAIYILVLVQFVGGWWVHSRAKGKRSIHEPLKAMVRCGKLLLKDITMVDAFTASSLARANYCTSRNRSDTFGANAVWITSFVVCSLCISGLRPGVGILYPDAPSRTP